MREVTERARADFENDGIAFLPQALEQPWIDLVKAGIKRATQAPGPYRRIHALGEPSEWIDDECSYFTTPEYKIFLHESPLVDLIADLMDCNELWLFFDQTFAKQGESGPTPWHQDTPYFCANGSKFVSVWINVDPVPLETSLRFVKGSFRGPLLEQEQSPNRDRRWPNVDEHRDDFDVVAFAIKPGDLVVFHPSTLHGGAPGTGGRRRSVSFRLYGDDVVFQHAPAGDMVPALPGILASGLQPGDPLRGPWFPQLLPRPHTLVL
jgi:ectoine hydroxylase-related dioxygenase (phytanoyl-CoA dioxygenase family)